LFLGKIKAPKRVMRGALAMPVLYHPQRYPPALQDAILKLPPRAIEIANRWLRDWPQATKQLLQTDHYLERLTEQTEREQAAYSAENLRLMPRFAIEKIYHLRRSPPIR
jgi:hypothetical protein